MSDNCETNEILLQAISDKLKGDPSYDHIINNPDAEPYLINHFEKEAVAASSNRQSRDCKTTDLYTKYVDDYAERAEKSRKYRHFAFCFVFSFIILLTAAIIVSIV